MDNPAIVDAPSGPPAPRSASAARRLAVGFTDLLLPVENPSGAIYGLIVVGALLAAESGRHESYLDTLLSAAIAVTLYWVAHAYAGALGLRLTDHRRLTPGVLLRALRHDLALIRGAGIPLVALVVAAIAGATQETAVTAAVWSAVASLALLELFAGLRSGASRSELALETSVGLAMGIAILALKIVLH
jgi:hypothetical protein